MGKQSSFSSSLRRSYENMQAIQFRMTRYFTSPQSQFPYWPEMTQKCNSRSHPKKREKVSRQCSKRLTQDGLLIGELTELCTPKGLLVSVVFPKGIKRKTIDIITYCEKLTLYLFYISKYRTFQFVTFYEISLQIPQNL